MSFCTNCGSEITPGSRFCGTCGKEQQPSATVCPKCNKKLKENENFCSNCGTVINNIPNPGSEKEPETQKPKLTNEGRKIIDAGPKAGSKRPVKKNPASKPIIKSKSSQKKKRSSVGCFFRTIFILGAIVIGAAAIIFVVNIFIEDTENSASETQKIAAGDEGQLKGTDIPGIVDIEEGDLSHLPENRDNSFGEVAIIDFSEERALKETTQTVEKAFAAADTVQLKSLLTDESKKKYEGVFKSIQPEMSAYATAFDSKKLIAKTEIYALYLIEDEDGNEYTAEFAQVEPGVWKLVRF